MLRVGVLGFRGCGVAGSGTMRQHPPLVMRKNSIWQMIWKLARVSPTILRKIAALSHSCWTAWLEESIPKANTKRCLSCAKLG